jgi:hypothetical protein
MFDAASFTFVLPCEHELMHPFPRLHPLWHKSQMDYAQPDLSTFPDYNLRHAMVAEVEPGYILYKSYLLALEIIFYVSYLPNFV